MREADGKEKNQKETEKDGERDGNRKEGKEEEDGLIRRRRSGEGRKKKKKTGWRRDREGRGEWRQVNECAQARQCHPMLSAGSCMQTSRASRWGEGADKLSNGRRDFNSNRPIQNHQLHLFYPLLSIVVDTARALQSRTTFSFVFFFV